MIGVVTRGSTQHMRVVPAIHACAALQRGPGDSAISLLLFSAVLEVLLMSVYARQCDPAKFAGVSRRCEQQQLGGTCVAAPLAMPNVMHFTALYVSRWYDGLRGTVASKPAGLPCKRDISLNVNALGQFELAVQ